MPRPFRADLAGVTLGDASPVAVMGVINVSPESFHAGSVYHGDEAVLKAALGMVEAGAGLVDGGAPPGAPDLKTGVSEGGGPGGSAGRGGGVPPDRPAPGAAATTRPPGGPRAVR